MELIDLFHLSISGIFSCYLALTGRRKLRLCLPPAISRVFFITSDDVVENLRVERVDNKKGKSSGSRGTGGGGAVICPLPKLKSKYFPSIDFLLSPI